MRKLSILLAGVCLTAALYSAGTTYGQNKTNSNDQRQSQRKSDKTTSQRTKKRTLR